MVDPSRHADSRNIVEAILRYIPGFRGYLEKEYRRDSDYLARTWLADQIRACKASLDRYQRSLVDAGQLDVLPQCEHVRTRLDTLESRMRGAVRGYSGFFDFVRVKEDLLDRVYAHDMSLIGDIQALQKATEGLAATGDDPAKAIGHLLTQVDDLHRKFDERSNLLEGISGAS